MKEIAQKEKYKIVNIMDAEPMHRTRLRIRHDGELFASRLVKAPSSGGHAELPEMLVLYTTEHPRVGDIYSLTLTKEEN